MNRKLFNSLVKSIKEMSKIRLKSRIKNLEAVIERQKEVIERQGNANEEKHNILCGIKEEIDEYFLKG